MRRLYRQLLIVFLCSTTSAALAASQAYIEQLDAGQTSQSPNVQQAPEGPAYIEQLPADSRPAAPSPAKKRKVAASKKQVAQKMKANLPDVGIGVTLALAPAKSNSSLPNVGRGVVR
jgi:hypothetical protein